VIFLLFMNAFTTFMFIFCPYHVGKLAVTVMALQEKVDTFYFNELMAMILGYYFVMTFLYILTSVTNHIGLRHYQQFVWLCFMFAKVRYLIIIN